VKKIAASLGAFLLLALLVPPIAAAQTTAAAPPVLTREEMREFLLKAKVIKSRDTSKGITSPKRLTLSNGALTHDAAFQSVDEHSTVANLRGSAGPSIELNFIDHYRYNLAAYAISGLLGLDYMMPVHVKRRWSAKDGSLSWWVDTLMDEGERLKKKVQPPNPADWNEQMYRMRVFAALVRDTDRNLGNVLITPEWKVIMIDFTRAFRPQTELVYSKDLPKIDRTVLPKLEALTKDSIKAAVGDELTNPEIDAVMKRRDVIVAHFRKLIAEQGEDKVLY
jgi:hypothetical protein